VREQDIVLQRAKEWNPDPISTGTRVMMSR
jgi:hypothetical protein